MAFTHSNNKNDDSSSNISNDDDNNDDAGGSGSGFFMGSAVEAVKEPKFGTEVALVMRMMLELRIHAERRESA